MSEAPQTANRQQTIEAILDASQRSTLPIRASFVQASPRGPGPLATIVRRSRETAWEQYALLHAWASGGDFSVRRDARLWARAIGAPPDESGLRAVSRNWRFLRELGLIETQRTGRHVRAVILREDGSGRAYSHPGRGRRTRYLQLPYAYWQEGWHERLELPGKALLLIALTLGDLFRLPADQGPDWYGLSPSTVERGLRDLRRADLLAVAREPKVAPLAPAGYTIENYYVLQPPFGPQGRRAAGAPDAVHVTRAGVLKRAAMGERP